MVNLRDYQKEAVEKVEEAWRDGERPLAVLATGTGKTVVMSKLAQNAVLAGGRVLLLAHRGELLDQATNTVKKVTGLRVGREQSGFDVPTEDDHIVVGSIQSIVQPNRLKRVSGDGYTHVFIDEAHHSRSDTYETVIDALGGSKLLGVTATPDRGDQKALGKVYTKMAYRYDLADAVRDGYLCPIKALMLPLKLDISKVRVTSGDYSANDIGGALDPYLPEIASAMVDAGCGIQRKTVVFCPLVSTADKVAEELRRWNIDAASVSGQSKDRKEILEDFASKKTGVLCNSMLLTEGWDCPDVSCVVVLRPTRSRSLFCQMVGRGTRLSPETGKQDLLLLDFLWQTEDHDLCRPSCLVAKDPDIAKRMDDQSIAGLVDILDAEALAEAGAAADREAALAKQLEEKRRKKKKLVDPLAYAASVGSYDLLSYVPTFAWEMRPPTDPQVETIEKFGIDPEGIENSGMASKVISTVTDRINRGLATAKQVRFLEQKGFRHVGKWSFKDADSMISRIANNKWRVPWGIKPANYVPTSLFR